MPARDVDAAPLLASAPPQTQSVRNPVSNTLAMTSTLTLQNPDSLFPVCDTGNPACGANRDPQRSANR